MQFAELGLRQELIKSLQEEGIVEPTSIQEKGIPAILAGKDLVGISKTGSGKTAAFGLPLLEKLDKQQGLQYLIIAPTRELVVQIADEIRKFGKYFHFKMATVFGGVAIGPQIDAVEIAHVVVATPGRLKDHLERRTIDLSRIKAVVLDEADKMVEMGFIEDIEFILKYTPPKKQILLFGATISSEIDYLKKKYIDHPEVVESETYVQEEYLQQCYYNVKQFEKFSLLAHLLKKEKIKRAIVFCSARSTVELVTKNLRKQGFAAEMIHGKLNQSRKLQTIKDFHAAKFELLIASAVAARGLHIEDVSHVFNYDLSRDPQEYVHRVGRTARAGDSGKAITLLSEKDFDVFNDILKRYRHLKIEEMPLEPFEKLQFDAQRPERRGFGREGGRNGSPQHFSRDGPRRNGFQGRSSGFRGERPAHARANGQRRLYRTSDEQSSRPTRHWRSY